MSTDDDQSRQRWEELLTEGLRVSGYEIHAGLTEGGGGDSLFALHNVEDGEDCFDDGALSEDNQVMGTDLHGLFDETAMLRHWLHWAGLPHVEAFDYHVFRDAQIDRIADVVEAEMPLDDLLQLLSAGD